jgi:hypothetical protein
MSIPPSIALSLVLASGYGCLFHVIFGRRLWQWPLFWATAVLGFFGGYVLAIIVGVEWLRVGSVPVAAASAGALSLLTLAWYFSAPAGQP